MRSYTFTFTFLTLATLLVGATCDDASDYDGLLPLPAPAENKYAAENSQNAAAYASDPTGYTQHIARSIDDPLEDYSAEAAYAGATEHLAAPDYEPTHIPVEDQQDPAIHARAAYVPHRHDAFWRSWGHVLDARDAMPEAEDDDHEQLKRRDLLIDNVDYNAYPPPPAPEDHGDIDASHLARRAAVLDEDIDCNPYPPPPSPPPPRVNAMYSPLSRRDEIPGVDYNAYPPPPPDADEASLAHLSRREPVPEDSDYEVDDAVEKQALHVEDAPEGEFHRGGNPPKPSAPPHYQSLSLPHYSPPPTSWAHPSGPEHSHVTPPPTAASIHHMYARTAAPPPSRSSTDHASSSTRWPHNMFGGLLESLRGRTRHHARAIAQPENEYRESFSFLHSLAAPPPQHPSAAWMHTGAERVLPTPGEKQTGKGTD